MTAILAGILRAIVPAIVGYFAGKGVDISGLATPEVTAAVATVIAAGWSVAAKTKKPAPTP